ncbi:MAG TPA: hypothetical protein VNR00_07845 [Opitutus sp.]|nr:hypothetical protein [Opitutus sp.]
MSTRIPFNEDAVCSACGCFGAYQFDGRVLCAECYAGCGACCAEFAGFDLTASADEAASEAPEGGRRDVPPETPAELRL